MCAVLEATLNKQKTEYLATTNQDTLAHTNSSSLTLKFS